jgi:sugar lactone lactonase YvrE
LARGSDGRPSGPPTDWISGWQEEKGVRPRGRPNGLALDHLGRLWVVEDFNRSLIVLMRPDGRGL